MELLSIEQGRAIRLAGELDMSNESELDEVLGAAVEQGGAILVDLSELTFMDSTGISVLLNALRHLKTRSGNLVLVCPTERILRPFQITGLVGRLGIFSSRDEALGGVVAS